MNLLVVTDPDGPGVGEPAHDELLLAPAKINLQWHINWNKIVALTSKPKQILFFFRKSFSGIPREFCGRISLI